MIDTTLLTTAYNNLRDYLAEEELYASTPTPHFDRTHLAKLFTAYYDAEAAARNAAEAAEAVSGDTRYLREGLRDESTEIAGGLVLAKFLGVKGDDGAVTSGLTAGQIDRTEAPLFFAGAESMPLSLTVYAPSAGSTAFGNTELICTPGGMATVPLPCGRHDMRGGRNFSHRFNVKVMAGIRSVACSPNSKLLPQIK